MSQEEFKKNIETRKFHWINFGLIGIGVSITLLSQAKNTFIFLSMVMFTILVLFEAIGLWIVESNELFLGSNEWYTKLWFQESTLIDVILLVISMLLLGLGFYFK